MCTCQGAAFEYIFNVEHEIRKAGLRDMADIQWISNESFMGDFGMGGLHMKVGGYVVSSRILYGIFVRRTRCKLYHRCTC